MIGKKNKQTNKQKTSGVIKPVGSKQQLKCSYV